MTNKLKKYLDLIQQALNENWDTSEEFIKLGDFIADNGFEGMDLTQVVEQEMNS